MKTVGILLLILLGLCILWGISSLIGFVIIHKRVDTIPPLNQVDLSGTHYSAVSDLIAEHMEKAEKHSWHRRFLCSRDGFRLEGLYYDHSSRKTVLFVPGYHATPFNNFSFQINCFIEQGYNVLLIYQRGHGPSQGHFISFGIREQYDLLDWTNLALSEPNVDELVVYGTSMGSATVGFASDKLADPRIKALVMDCGYNRLEDVLSKNNSNMLYVSSRPWFRLFYLLFFGARLKDLQVSDSVMYSLKPIFLLHGSLDESVPVEHTAQNASAMTAAHDVYYSPLAGHTTALLAGAPASTQALFAFLKKYIVD